MLVGGRFDLMISIDLANVEAEFKMLGFTDYALTEYKFVKCTGVYYASSKCAMMLIERQRTVQLMERFK